MPDPPDPRVCPAGRLCQHVIGDDQRLRQSQVAKRSQNSRRKKRSQNGCETAVVGCRALAHPRGGRVL
eukprot:1762454-Pyramimonas_sp.AAC.1